MEIEEEKKKQKNSNCINYITTSNMKFCHYTSVKNAREILSSGMIYMNKYNSMNDLAESASHKEDMNRVFVLSFTHSDALNIPIFYLYGGIDGKGCRIQLTESKIRAMIQDAEIHFVNKQNKCLQKPAVSPSDYTILFDWIYYITQGGHCEHFGDDQDFDDLDSAKKELAKIDRQWFIKNPIWKYEKEFRIVVKFNRDVPYNRISLKIPIKPKEKGISILLGPEFEKEKLDEIKEEFSEYGVGNVDLAYPDRISMGLVDRNKELLK